jgi:hypothetical protein
VSIVGVVCITSVLTSFILDAYMVERDQALAAERAQQQQQQQGRSALVQDAAGPDAPPARAPRGADLPRLNGELEQLIFPGLEVSERLEAEGVVELAAATVPWGQYEQARQHVAQLERQLSALRAGAGAPVVGHGH